MRDFVEGLQSSPTTTDLETFESTHDIVSAALYFALSEMMMMMNW